MNDDRPQEAAIECQGSDRIIISHNVPSVSTSPTSELWTPKKRRLMAQDLCESIWGNREGFAVLAFGQGPYWENGKYKHQRFTHQFYNWPIELEPLLQRGMAMADTADVYACPLLRDAPSRNQRVSGPLPGSWAWLDADDWDDARQAELDGFDTQVLTVLSGGGPASRHIFVGLDADYTGEQVTAISASLEKRFQTDTHGGNNKLLRLPGTYNHKPAALGGDPTPVVLLW